MQALAFPVSVISANFNEMCISYRYRFVTVGFRIQSKSESYGVCTISGVAGARFIAQVGLVAACRIHRCFEVVVSCEQVIKKQLADGVSMRRVGLVSTGAPARQHSEILSADGKPVRPRGI
jgi:hypothetical protein